MSTAFTGGITRASEIRRRTLAGEDPVRVARELGYHNPHGDAMKAIGGRGSIAERNRQNFQMVLEDELAPYRAFVRALKADKTEPFTDHETKRTLYRTVPDHPTRMKAAERILLLQGMDPRTELKVQVGTGAGSTTLTMTVNDLYLQVALNAGAKDEETLMRELNQVNQTMKDGRMMLVPPGYFDKAEEDGSGERTPIGVEKEENQ